MHEVKTGIYFTAYNSSRPFKVVVEENKVNIYTRIDNNAEDANLYNIPVLEIDDPVKVYADVDRYSFLIQENKTEYVYVGRFCIYRFKPFGDIVEYYQTVIGGKGGPYPYAYDTLGYAYLMAEKVYFNKDQFGRHYDPYRRYYEVNSGQAQWKADHTHAMDYNQLYPHGAYTEDF